MTQENRSPRAELEATITRSIHASTHGPDCDFDTCSEDAYTFEDEALAALHAIKEAGGVVLMPRDIGAKRAWGEITEIPGAYINVLEADPS